MATSLSLPRFPSRLESVVPLPTFREHFVKMVKLKQKHGEIGNR